MILRDLGRLDRLIACTKYCFALCPELGKMGDRHLTIVSDSWTAKAEQIRAVGGDLVIASVPYREQALSEILKSGLPLLALAPQRLADVYSDIALIARLVEASEEGARIVDTMQAEIRAMEQRTRHLSKPRVFCE
ncbi:MAG: ABC transporter substrate-binding protein, partial [Deltaproteobacteria bacterium]|nr:ABC transporter substrate-binding protein [Deltaproteobacteria bacterium]